MGEVEDIMFDQRTLLSDSEFDNKSFLILPASKLWVVIGILTRTLLPPVSSVYYTLLRNPQSVVVNMRYQLLPALVTFLANSISRSLSSVPKISLPLTLRIIKEDQNEEAPIATGEIENLLTERSVECLVLSSPEEFCADVIFVHGLHGGIDKTWKQGTWRHNGHKLNNQLPVRRQSTGNLFVPPKQQFLKRTISGIYSKIPKKTAKTEEGTWVVQKELEYDMDDNSEVFDNYSECWPRDWIPKDCPNVRVIALNYSTDVLWCPVWAKKRKRTDMVTRSQEMIEELVKIDVGKKPIVWVGHSKGGLFIKQIIVTAWENNQHRPDVCDLFQQSKSIMWYSVPHRGTSLADCTLPLLRRSVELLEIKRNCTFVLDLHQKFMNIVEHSALNPDVFSFIETSFTLMSLIYIKIVAYDSADPHIGTKCDVPLDHREICKPAGRDCFLYLELIKLINKCIERNR